MPQSTPPQIKTAPKTERKGSRKFSDLSQQERDYVATPSGFAQAVLKMPLYPKQAEIIDSVRFGNSVSAVMCNEYGKTTRCIAALVLHHIVMFPRSSADGGVIATSGSWNQVLNQLMPALRAYQDKLPGYTFKEHSIDKGGYPQFLAFSTREANRAEGFHGNPASPLMTVIDEWKGVPDDICFAMQERCNPQRFAGFSSPGYALGEFYQSHHGKARFYQQFKAAAARINADHPDGFELTGDAPHISPESIKKRVEKWGINHPMTRSMIFAEFMDIVQGAMITAAEIEACLENPGPYKPNGQRKAFLDFAAGGDENVIAFREGNRVRIAAAWREKDTMAAVGRFVIELNNLKRHFGLQPSEVEGDASGLGKPMIDRIREAGWPIGEAFNQEAPRYSDRYANLASETWIEGCMQIQRKEVILMDDLEFKAQAVNRRMVPHSKGLLKMESKDDMKKATRDGGAVPESPDRAEAVFGALMPAPHTGRMNLIEQATNEYIEAMEQHGQIDERILAGAFAG